MVRPSPPAKNEKPLTAANVLSPEAVVELPTVPTAIPLLVIVPVTYTSPVFT